jgi:hypothetical protein
MKHFRKHVMTTFLSCCSLAIASPAQAQSFDPRAPLGQLIQAFQVCGPPMVYQMLSPQLFQLIGQQTGGSGCYREIAAAGPIINMQILDYREFPLGPLYVIRVFHNAGPVDWFIGFNRFNGKVESLNFQAGQSTPPNIGTGPSGGGGGGSPPNPNPTPPPTSSGGGSTGGGGSSDGCQLYPAMC